MSAIKADDDCCQIILLDILAIRMRLEFDLGRTLVTFRRDDAHKKLMRIQLQFTTVAEKFNQGEVRKPGCILVFGVLFGYFLDKQKVTEKNHQTNFATLPFPPAK